jgi:hypothetical protein
MEQTFFYYVKKCFPSAVNRELDSLTNTEVDILIPEKYAAIEYNSKYFHRAMGNREERDIKKLYKLAQYYKVFSIQEYPSDAEYPLIEIITVPEWRWNAETRHEYEDIIYALFRKLAPDEKSYPNINIERDTLEILQQYITCNVENSFEDKYPLLSRDWAVAKNGSLTPSMFRYGTGNYKFWWICRNCKRSYRTSMTNRAKTNPDKCHFCAHDSKDENCGGTKNMLSEAYPQITPFWHEQLNDDHPDGILAHSEKIRIFRLSDGRIVPVRICNMVYALRDNPKLQVDDYLESVFAREAEKH